MVNGIGTQQVGGMQGFKKPDPTEMFKDLANKVGADENGITKDDLTTYLKKLQEEGKGDSREAKMISNLVEDFDNVSGGTDTITADSLQKAMQNRKPPSRFDFQDPSTVTSDQLKSPIDIRV